MASEDAKKAAQKHVDARLAPMMRALKIVRETNDKGRQALKAWADSNTRPAPAATDTGLVSNCDGKEQEAFETWAKSKRYDMHEHPLHYLFLDPKTNAAREGWNEAIRYCHSQAVELLAAKDREHASTKRKMQKLVNDVEAEWQRCCDDLKADNAAQAARIKELTRNLEFADMHCGNEIKRVTELEAKLAAAEKALEPFADIADLIDAETEGMAETDELVLHFNDYEFAKWPMSLFRQTRAVLGGKPS